MSWPNTVSLITGTVGDSLGSSGESADRIYVAVTPVFGEGVHRLLHAATGTVWDDRAVVTSGTPGLFVQVPHVDQPGFVDGQGNAVTDWYYLVQVITRAGTGKSQWSYYWQPRVADGDTVDLDTLGDGVLVTDPILVYTPGRDAADAREAAAQALASAQAADQSGTAAAGSAQAAGLSAQAANLSAQNAATAVTDALAAQSGAEAAESNAEDQAAAAGTSAGQASTSAGSAAASATAAQTARTGAESARTGAETAQAAAATTAAALAAQKGAANGTAPLDGSSKLPEANVPDRLSSTALNNAYAGRYAPGTGLRPLPLVDVVTLAAGTNPRPIEYARGYLWGRVATAVYRSSDMGVTWTPAFTSPVTFSGFVGTDDGQMLCLNSEQGANGGWYKSTGWSDTTHTATSWTKVLANSGGDADFYRFGLDGNGTKFIAAEYAETGIVFGAGRADSKKVWISQDAGSTWSVVYDTSVSEPADNPNTHLHGVCYDRYADRFYFVQGHSVTHGIYYSDNQGATWTKLTTLGFDPEPSPTVMQATARGIVCGTDSEPAGVYVIPRNADPSPSLLRMQVAYRWPSGATGLIGYAFGFAHDQATDTVYMGYRCNVAGKASILVASDGRVASKIWDGPTPASGTAAISTVAAADGKLAWYQTSNDGDFHYRASQPAFGSPGLDDTGNMLGGKVDRDTGSTGPGSLAVGAGSYATAVHAVSISPNDGQSTANYAIGIGRGVRATGIDSLSVGRSSAAAGTDSIAIGRSTQTPLGRGIAIGQIANAAGGDSIAIGSSGTTSSGSSAVAVGQLASATGLRAIALGPSAGATAQDAIAVGRNTAAGFTGTIALGESSTTGAANAIAIGSTGASAAGSAATAIGTTAAAAGLRAIAVGTTPVASATDSIAVGRNASATFTGNIVIGESATSGAANSIAIGSAVASAGGFSSIAIGTTASAAGSKAVALGNSAVASGSNALAVGGGTSATGNGSVAIGRDSSNVSAATSAADTIALGTALHTVVIAGKLAARSPYVAKTAAYTATATDGTINADATAGAFAVTLPTAAGVAGTTYVIRKADSSANAVTVGTTSAQTINGAATYPLSVQYQTVTVQSDGANWMVL